MEWILFVSQVLNGLQLGILLFLLAAGLTLVFGIMDFVNLAHGSLYMMGAYFCVTLTPLLDSFPLAVLAAIILTFVLGVVVELVVARHLYQRDHLDQVLATFGLILFFNGAVHLIWGAEGNPIRLPDFLDGRVTLFTDIEIPAFRLAIIAIGLAVAVGLVWLVGNTRMGMLIRAGASNRRMAGALGVDIKKLFTLVFALGAALAGLAGMMIAPISDASVRVRRWPVCRGLSRTMRTRRRRSLRVTSAARVSKVWVAPQAISAADFTAQGATIMPSVIIDPEEIAAPTSLGA